MRILAAFDLSPMGRRVVERARLIAEQQDAHLHLVHVLEPLHGAFLADDEAEFVADHRHSAAAGVADWIAGRTRVPVEFDVVRGAPSSRLAHLARSAEIVVTGTSSIDAARCGPLTRRLARKARVPLLAVRRQPRIPYRRAFAAVDLSDASVQALELAEKLAPAAELTAVLALPPHPDVLAGQTRLFEEEAEPRRNRRLRQAQEALEEFAAHAGVGARTLVVEGPPASAVGEAARRRGADLVTVSSRGAGATSMVLLGGTAEEIMESVHCDVAVARVEGTFRRP